MATNNPKATAFRLSRLSPGEARMSDTQLENLKAQIARERRSRWTDQTLLRDLERLLAAELSRREGTQS